MSFDTATHARFDDAFANLVSAFIRHDDLKQDNAPIGDRAHALFDLSSARNEAQSARRSLICEG